MRLVSMRGLGMNNEIIIGGFVVVYADSDAQDYVMFFDSLQDANAFAESILKEGYITAKVFKEV